MIVMTVTGAWNPMKEKVTVRRDKKNHFCVSFRTCHGKKFFCSVKTLMNRISQDFSRAGFPLPFLPGKAPTKQPGDP
jgi:hypothetical protein